MKESHIRGLKDPKLSCVLDVVKNQIRYWLECMYAVEGLDRLGPQTLWLKMPPLQAEFYHPEEQIEDAEEDYEQGNLLGVKLLTFGLKPDRLSNDLDNLYVELFIREFETEHSDDFIYLTAQSLIRFLNATPSILIRNFISSVFSHSLESHIGELTPDEVTEFNNNVLYKQAVFVNSNLLIDSIKELKDLFMYASKKGLKLPSPIHILNTNGEGKPESTTPTIVYRNGILYINMFLQECDVDNTTVFNKAFRPHNEVINMIQGGIFFSNINVENFNTVSRLQHALYGINMQILKDFNNIAVRELDDIDIATKKLQDKGNFVISHSGNKLN